MNKELAELIKSKRIEKGISQRELAKQIEVSNTIISRIESGIVKKPALEILIKLSIELKIFLGELMRLSGYSNADIYISTGINGIYLDNVKQIVGDDKIRDYLTDLPNGLVLDAYKILENYKKGNIDENAAVKLFHCCNPAYLDDKTIYQTYKGDIICDE